jgi:hypothetical protein
LIFGTLSDLIYSAIKGCVSIAPGLVERIRFSSGASLGWRVSTVLRVAWEPRRHARSKMLQKGKLNTLRVRGLKYLPFHNYRVRFSVRDALIHIRNVSVGFINDFFPNNLFDNVLMDIVLVGQLEDKVNDLNLLMLPHQQDVDLKVFQGSQ